MTSDIVVVVRGVVVGVVMLGNCMARATVRVTSLAARHMAEAERLPEHYEECHEHREGG